MTLMKEDMGIISTRKVLVGLRFDNEGKEILGWALVKVAEPHDHVVAVHVSRNSDEKEQKMLEGYLEIYKDLCDIKKVNLSGNLLKGKSIRKTLVKEAKDCSAVAVILGTSKFGAVGGWVSTANYCAKHLPKETDVFTVHNGKVVFKRRVNGSKGYLNSTIPKPEKHSGNQSEFGYSDQLEIESNSSVIMGQGSESGSIDNITDSIDRRSKTTLRSVSFNTESSNITEHRPGWPLLRRSSLPTQRALDSRKMSVVQWVMSLPDRAPPDTPQSSDSSSSKSESPLGRDSCSEGAFSRKSSHSLWSEWLEETGLPFESNLSDFIWFSYEVLRHATCHFSSENLIGKGGCSKVYKGTFLDGKQVAVKVLKSSKQGWKDFSLEVNIISSLRHTNITPLLGVCIDNSELICVYDFMSRGSLEENLHVEKNEKSVLSWDARYRVAVGIAEALHYLHNCSRPVIHRDVKSSNILLSNNFEPQLSDFGLALWGPNSTSSEKYTDVVGTFGYLAPEYFMHGKVTDKLDVYSFGVVLLELLSGKMAIDSCKGQESLVIWAKPKLESGKLSGILDRNLGEGYDECQMQRMVHAATLCLTRAARLRPNMAQILKLLKGEETIETWEKTRVHDHQKESDNLDINHDDNDDDGDDEIYQNSSTKESHMSLAMLDVEDDFTSSSSSVEPIQSPCLEDFLKGRISRTLSFH